MSGPVVEPGYRWQAIKDLPEDWQELAIPELSSLARVWEEQHVRLKESQAVVEFNEHLRREWSIETGILERLYTIDRGITQLLIEQGIVAALIPHGATDRPVEEVIHILTDHREALDGLFDFVSGRQPLTTSYIRQLHQVITRHQEFVDGTDQFGNPVRTAFLRGEWKKWPNNPTRSDGLLHEYCPPLQVAGEVERLVELYRSHSTVPPEVSAAWLHHRFTQVHPFQDGNGRVARALATLVFLQAGWFPIVINRDQRANYIAALEAADLDDLRPLVQLFGGVAKSAFLHALSLSEDVLQGEEESSLARVLDSLVGVYEDRRRSALEAFRRVESVASNLSYEAHSLLNEAALQIREKFELVNPPLGVSVHSSRRDQNHYYYSSQIVSVARELDYYANIALPRRWVRLYLVDGQKTQLVFSFHYLGKINRGVMVCTSFVYFPEARPGTPQEPPSEIEAEPQFGETHRLCSEPFYFTYMDETRLNGLRADFRIWVNEAIKVGLAEWAQRL